MRLPLWRDIPDDVLYSCRSQGSRTGNGLPPFWTYSSQGKKYCYLMLLRRQPEPPEAPRPSTRNSRLTLVLEQPTHARQAIEVIVNKYVHER